MFIIHATEHTQITAKAASLKKTSLLSMRIHKIGIFLNEKVKYQIFS